MCVAQLQYPLTVQYPTKMTKLIVTAEYLEKCGQCDLCLGRGERCAVARERVTWTASS